MVQDNTQKIHDSSYDLQEKAESALAEAHSIDGKHHFFTTVEKDVRKQVKAVTERIQKGETLPLAGMFISAKDCICVKGMETTASSDILKGYKPVFDATVIKRLRENGAIIIGKTVQDAFGFGSFATNVGKSYTRPTNPINPMHVCGGSSGGAAGLAQAATFPHVALGQSTGGSIVCPASFCDVVGLCPTYSLVSRNGLISYSNTLDKIGPIGKQIQDCALVLEAMAGYDTQDSTSTEQKAVAYADFSKSEEHAKKLKVGVITEFMDTNKGIDPMVRDKVQQMVEALRNNGVTVKEISLPFIAEYALSAYYLISMTEASTNLAALCGLRYGKQSDPKKHYNEYFTDIRSNHFNDETKRRTRHPCESTKYDTAFCLIIRSNHFNDETKRRIILGTFARMSGFRDAYYIKALKLRTKVIEEYKQMFSDYDILCSPTMPFTAPTFEKADSLEPIQEYMADNITVGANLAGLPHVSVPLKREPSELPIGMLLVSDHFQEKTIIDMAYLIQQLREKSE